MKRASLQRIDLATGTIVVLGSTPGPDLGGLAVTADRLYVPDLTRSQVWVADLHERPLTTIPAGRVPLAIVLGQPYPPPRRSPHARRAHLRAFDR